MNTDKKYSFDKNVKGLLENLSIPFAIYQFIDKKVVTILLSKGFCDEFGFKDLEEAYQVMDSNMFRAAHPEDRMRVEDASYRYAAFDEPYDIVYRSRTLKDPDYIIIHSFGKSFYPEDGVRLCLTWYANEGSYSDKQKSDKSVFDKTLGEYLKDENKYHGMYYDYLTGLPNMTFFFELVETGRKKMKEDGIDSVILYMNLTGLKDYNRRYGFEQGNRMISEVARILSSHFGVDNCARFAQDHFAVFTKEEGLNDHLEQIIEECSKINGGKSLPVRLGVYPSRIEDVDISAACDRARLAADIERNRKDSFYSYFDMDMMSEEKNRQAIIDNLDRAIEEEWIKIYYQPIVRSISGKVCNVEALARWDDPVRGLLMPSAFIPVLEDSRLISKLDMYMIRKVLSEIKENETAGNHNVPVSINLSRADFDNHNLVNDICVMVDDAKVDRKLINIEITESLVGSDFEFMKKQIENLQSHGFKVWMDDFGSGYSSLKVLQNIKFDLIKFDMDFMKHLDEGDDGKIIISQMIKMVSSLGIDTLCEGVETKEQYRFLQEGGCSKLQGYYFMKPSPGEELLKKYKGKGDDGFEDPKVSDYYDAVGRVNLFDLSFLANLDDDILKNTFDTVPMSVMEVDEEKEKLIYVRSNQAFRDFMKRIAMYDLSDPEREYDMPKAGPGYALMKAVNKCRSSGNRIFFEDKAKDGSRLNSFVRRIGKNPVNGREAFAIAVLSISDPDESTTYADIARSLAADYYNIYIIDLDTNEYIEYTSEVGDENMSLKRHGDDFFESARRETMTRIYEDDRQHFLSIFTKENVLDEIDKQGVFTTTYRLTDSGTPMYVNMKITRMLNGNRLILGVSIIDAHMKQLEVERNLRQERISLGRIAALSPDYIVLYMIDPITNHYTQFDPSNEFANLNLDVQGDDFFADVVRDAPKVMAQEDMERHLKTMTKENILNEIKNNGYFVYNYRFLLNGKFVPASLRASIVEENDGQKIILGVSNDELEYKRQLEEAYKQASRTATIYTHVAHALARDYTDLYYVNMESEEFIAFHTDDKSGVLTEARRGKDFFETGKKEAKLYVHEDDLEEYLKIYDREFLNRTLDRSKVYELSYRRIDKGTPFYVQTKITRMEDDKRYIVIAISDIDELVRQRKAEEKIQEERIIYARLHALTGNFIVVYVVDPKTGEYREFSSTADFEQGLGQEKTGTDFFNKVREVGQQVNHPDDLKLFMSAFNKENILSQIERDGSFSLSYRLMIDGKPLHVQMKAAMIEEKEGRRLIVGLNDISAQVKQEQSFMRKLNKAQTQVNVDALTGVRNKHAYLGFETAMDHRILEHKQMPFAVIMLDTNDLKLINDTKGHQAGDQYLRDACRTICNIFKHSPVFRVGGDEFTVIAQESDYDNIDKLVAEVAEYNKKALKTGEPVIACGMSRFDNDDCVATVFERADHNMYENKNDLKSDKN
ncbi:MAG: EAL domain-containing protein [Erysipelotrichaceae bacterium]|nr:EAL domain-containing protein [Erysipelotrichaceae bacterium]